MYRKVITAFVLLTVPVILMAADVSPALATLLARNFLNEKFSVLSGAKACTLEPVVIPVTVDDHPVYYFIEFPGSGFVAVAGDDRCSPVLAWSLEPVDGQSGMPPACAAWFDWYARQVTEVREKNYTATADIADLWATYGDPAFKTGKNGKDVGVGPLTVSKWGQRYYYNNMCPVDPDGPGGHAIAGCVATAMAQVLFYYRFPEHGEGANGYMSDYGYEYVDFEEAEYRWDEMVNAVYGVVNTEVTELIYHVGVSVEMNYGPTSSGAMTEETVDAFKNYFRYDDALHYISKFDLGEAFRDSVIDNLDRNLVMIYRGGSFGSAHSFVCDGYQDSTFFHFNWGWDGNYNGYYTMENLHPSVYDFTFDQGAVINIYPREEYPGYCQGGKTLTASRGTFEDGSGPESSPANLSCDFLIDPGEPDITNIMVWFTRFSTDEGSGVVTVYDGADAGAPVLGQYSGSTLPPMVVSGSNNVFITYETGPDATSEGWQVEYLAYDGPFCNPTSQLNAISVNYLSDGSGPYNYTDLSDCGWLISPQAEEYDSISSINFSFHWMDLGPGDTLYLHDGTDNTAPVIGKYFGSQIPGPLQTEGNKLYVNFVSDEQFNADGWAATYSSNLPVYCTDTLLYTDKTGILEDGSGNKKYAPNTSCHWMVSTENTEAITFEFLEFDLEYGYDQLRFYDATSSPMLPVATYFGHDLPAMLTLDTDKVLIWFFSDDSQEFGGWKVKYTALAPGMAENGQPVNYRLSPNPASGRVQLQVAGGEPDRQAEYLLYDAAMGIRKKGQVPNTENQTEIDISALTPGIYFMVISGGKGRVVRKLIVL